MAEARGRRRSRHRRRAALQAKVLRKNILDVASVILQTKPDDLDIVNNAVVDVQGGQQRIELNELARIVYFRPDTLPPESNLN
jgi:carbon-monoxide dehydrogenase large subunit